MSILHDDPEMKGQRARTAKGTLRVKRKDTHVKTIEEQYNRNFHVNGNMHIETLLAQTGKKSVKALIKSQIGR